MKKNSTSYQVVPVHKFVLPKLFIGKPTKYFGLAQGGVAYATAGTWTLLNSPAQGTTELTRVGSSVRFHGLELTAVLQASNVTHGVINNRTMIVYDREANINAAAYIAPIATDVLYSANPLSQYNFENIPRDLSPKPSGYRFSVLFDKISTQGPAAYPAGVFSSAASAETFNLSTRLRGELDTKFAGVGGTIANVQSGALWLFQITDTVNASLNWSSDMPFTDID